MSIDYRVTQNALLQQHASCTACVVRWEDRRTHLQIVVSALDSAHGGAAALQQLRSLLLHALKQLPQMLGKGLPGAQGQVSNGHHHADCNCSVSAVAVPCASRPADSSVPPVASQQLTACASRPLCQSHHAALPIWCSRSLCGMPVRCQTH